jgi:hypothetical protein
MVFVEAFYPARIEGVEGSLLVGGATFVFSATFETPQAAIDHMHTYIPMYADILSQAARAPLTVPIEVRICPLPLNTRLAPLCPTVQ